MSLRMFAPRTRRIGSIRTGVNAATCCCEGTQARGAPYFSLFRWSAVHLAGYRKHRVDRTRGHGIKSELVSNSTTSPRERNSSTIASSTGILTRKAPRVELIPLISSRSLITTLLTCC